MLCEEGRELEPQTTRGLLPTRPWKKYVCNNINHFLPQQPATQRWIPSISSRTLSQRKFGHYMASVHTSMTEDALMPVRTTKGVKMDCLIPSHAYKQPDTKKTDNTYMACSNMKPNPFSFNLVVDDFLALK
jgi:hypothetical protein